MRMPMSRSPRCPSVLPIAASLFVTAACGTDPGTDPGGKTDDNSSRDPIELASCDMPSGGVPWDPDGTGAPVEATPNFDADLRALEADIAALPAQIDTSALPAFFRSVIAYTLDVDVSEISTVLDRDATSAEGPMGHAVLGAFASARKQGSNGIDLLFLRRGLHRFYDCQQRFPVLLEDFRATVLDYTTIPGRIVDSFPKGGPRRLRAASALGIYVAETLVDELTVRETEILFTNARMDGAITFATYGADGRLTDRSEFASPPGNHEGLVAVAASPYACMSCHYDPATKRFDVLVPHLQ